MTRFRLVAAAALCVAMTALVGAQEKKPADPKAAPAPADPKAAPQPPKDPKAAPADPKAPQPPKTPDTKTPTPADPKAAPQPPKTPDPKAPQPPTPPAPAGAGKERFELKFTKDEKGGFGPAYYQKMTTVAVQTIKVQSQDLTQKQESTFYFTWTPVRQEMDGSWVLKQKVDALVMKIDISGNPIEYSSLSKDATGAAGNPGLVEFFKGLEGAEFTATLNKDFQVTKVDGREEFVKKLAAGNTQMNALLDKIMTPDALKQMVDPTFGIVPKEPQAIGGKWDRKAVLNLGPIGSYDVTYHFTYTGRDPKDGLDRIEVKTDLKYIAPKDSPDGLLFKIKKGELTSTNPEAGQITYDPKAGRIRSARVVIKLEGSLTVTIGGTDTTVELSQTQTTTLTGQDTPFAEVTGKK